MPGTVSITEKMKQDWDRRAEADPRFWVAATAEADVASYEASAVRDTRFMLESLEARLDLSAARVLDLGCGIGRLSAPLAERCGHVVGLDVSPKMIEEARQMHTADNLEFVVGSGADLADLADASFDVVISFSVLPHLPADVLRRYFAEINRVLKPGGLFRYQFWVGPRHEASNNDTLSIRVYEEAAFDRLNEAYGFLVEAVTEFDVFDPVLELRPVRVTTRKTGEADPVLGMVNEVRQEAPSDKEAKLEYDLMLYLAMKHTERGELAQAEAALIRAIQMAPERPEGWLDRVEHRIASSDLEGARDLLKEMVKINPLSLQGWLHLAQAERAMGDKSRARAALRSLRALGPLPQAVAAEAGKLSRHLR